MNAIQKKAFLLGKLFFLSFAVHTFAALDQNGNELSDVWEERFSATGLDPNADEDNDLRTNREESIAGTDPFKASMLKASNRTVAPGTFSSFLEVDSQNSNGMLVWRGVAGKVYKVQSTTDLTQWNNLITILADEDAEFNFVENFDEQKKFLRVLVEDTDADKDTLSAYEERFLGTSDYNSDTDGDKVLDSFEIFNSKNPADPESTPPVKWVVAPDGSGDFTDLKSAIAAIDADHQIIMMMPGTYTGTENTGISLEETDHEILIIGEQGPGNTRIDGAGQYECLYFANASAIVGISIVDCTEGVSLALTNNAQTANSLTRDSSSSKQNEVKIKIAWNP